MTDQEKLDAYAVEIYDGTRNSISVQELIDSHRRMRERNKRDSEERIKSMIGLREHVAEETRREIRHGEYISVEKLKSMTMTELVDFLADHSNC